MDEFLIRPGKPKGGAPIESGAGACLYLSNVTADARGYLHSDTFGPRSAAVSGQASHRRCLNIGVGPR
jgi:hypothetical protein